MTSPSATSEAAPQTLLLGSWQQITFLSLAYCQGVLDLPFQLFIPTVYL